MKRLSLILVIVLIASCLGSGLSSVAFAASETVYTNVLEDLSKDATFDAGKYPEKNVDTMDVIQIAESNDGELFLYVYSTTAEKFTASEVRISTTVGENVSPVDYKLTLLNRSGTLHKYKVESFTVSDSSERYYYVIQLARPLDKSTETVNNNTLNTKAYAVGKQFRACTVGSDVTYSEAHEDVIEITAKYCGYIRNFAGWVGLVTGNTDSHFIAFDTDVKIDKLMEAEVTYDSINYSVKVNGLTGLTLSGTEQEIQNSKKTGEKATLSADREVQAPTAGLFGREYEWTEIQSVEDFLELEELTDAVREEVEGKQWVLRFALTPVINYNMSLSALTSYMRVATKVTDASILRLKFITNGETYDLGVVDNKQTGSVVPSNPSAESKWEETLKSVDDFFAKIGAFIDKSVKWIADNWWIALLALVGIALVIALIVAIVKQGIVVVCKVAGTVLWWIVKVVFYIVTLPVWLIVWGVRA
ncbi:MAG: hypothetical protein NC099_06505, partial [Corallococcus sp.]|nr:hypothetical protein [Corallococcus sp.]